MYITYNRAFIMLYFILFIRWTKKKSQLYNGGESYLLYGQKIEGECIQF